MGYWQPTDWYFAIGRVGTRAAEETVWRRFALAEVIPRVILPPGSREADPRIKAIRRVWRANTGALSVLRSDHPARASF